MRYNIITAEEAATYVNHNDNVGFSGFTASGTPKVITVAIANRAEAEHAAGRPFQIGIFTGASTSDKLDGALARAKAIKFRTPYQSSADLRSAINAGEVPYFDMHLSELAPKLRYNYFGKINIAIIEASSITDDGKIYLGTGVGIAPTICNMADKILIELNSHLPKELAGFHDIYEPLDPPYRREIPIYTPSDRVGTPYVQVDPNKIIGVVETNLPDGTKEFDSVNEVTMKIGKNVSDFLASQLANGGIPKEFLPIQSGVGNIANAVLSCMGDNPQIPPFQMYTEVVQDSVIDLMKKGRCTFASTCSLNISDHLAEELFHDLDSYRDKLVLRPSEISNHPGMVHRLGLISINTALEVDIFGNVNSTHVAGTKMMNGIGGSGDFTRNAYMSIFTCPSVNKGGKISAIVPMVSHMDHSEHSVRVVITEWGVADLRGKDPRQRAEAIIENCAHPMYRPLLRQYLEKTESGHIPHDLSSAFAFHEEFLRSGDMSQTKF
ncbi:MAG: succinate CoA transferase [Bacteroidales bacterium]|nr:succinate CoA transferase [Bacteroidales bacterium]